MSLKKAPSLAARLLLGIGLALLGHARTAAQETGGFSPYRLAGQALASAYGQWHIRVAAPVTQTDAPVSIPLNQTEITLPDGPTLAPLQTGTPVLVNSPGEPNETISPEIARCSTAPTGECLTASFAYPRPNGFTLASATGGLQEAINAMHASGGGMVLVTPGFQGNSQQILAAAPEPDVLIQDSRDGTLSWYSDRDGAMANIAAVNPTASSSGIWARTLAAQDPPISSTALGAEVSATAFAGGDAGAQIAACLAAANATTGICDARGLAGANLTAAENMFAGLTKPFVLLLGNYNLNVSIPQVLPVPGLIEGTGSGTVVAYTGSSGPLFEELYQSSEGVSYPVPFQPGIRSLTLTGPGTAGSYGLLLGPLLGPEDLSTLSRYAGVVTATTAAPVDLQPGTVAQISGASDTSFDGTFVVSVTGPNTFSFAQAGPEATATGGTVQQTGGGFGTDFQDLDIRQFGVGVEFGSNAYAIHFSHVYVEANSVAGWQEENQSNELFNLGEQINCDGCFTADSPDLVDIESGSGGFNFNFVDSSFDQGLVNLSGLPNVGLTDPHFEGYPSAPFVAIDGGTLTINGGDWTSDAAPAVPIASLSRGDCAGSCTVTVSLATADNFRDGSEVNISAVSDPSFDGNFVIHVIDATTFSYTQSGTPATVSDSGTATEFWPTYIQASGSSNVNVSGSMVGSFGSLLGAFVTWSGSGALHLAGNTVLPEANALAWTNGFSSTSNGSVENPLLNTTTMTGTVQIPSLQLGGDSPQTAETRAVLTGFMPTTATAGTVSAVTFDKPVLITRIDAYAAGGTVAGCTTAADVTVEQSGQPPVDLPLTNGAQSWGTGVALNAAAGVPIQLGLAAAATGCSPPPTNVTVYVQYKMQ